METRDIIVVGASSGGVAALKEFVAQLPEDFKGSVFVVLHIPQYSESRLPEILSLAGPLKAVHPRDGEEIQSGKIYVAPNDLHLIVEVGRVRVKRGPKENKFRPSIDALFRSAAHAYGSRVVGIILSGILDDGVSGMWAIKQQGGVAIVQSLDDAEQPQLAINVLEYIEADYSLAASDMGPLIAAMVEEPAEERFKLSTEQLDLLKKEVIIAKNHKAFEMGIIDMGELTPLTYPACHGSLVRLVEGNILRYRCHTGHAYTASSLLAELTETLENQLWQTVRGYEEMTMLSKSIAEQYENFGNKDAAKLFRKKADESANRARKLHDEVFEQQPFSGDLPLNRSSYKK